MYPWHWLTLNSEGDAHPCHHGSHSVGNIRRSSVENVWNSALMCEVRASILAGKVHKVCETTNCPHQLANDAFSPPEEKAFLDAELSQSFDDKWYLAQNPDVAAAVQRLEFVSGLEHFAKFGRGEGRPYRLASRIENEVTAPVANALLAIREYSAGATRIASLPVDIVLQISSICNLRCVMCGHGVGTVDNPRHMPVEVIEHASEYLSVAARMIFSGMGEPLLAPSFWKVIENYGHSSHVFIRANSNGHFITPENSVRILASGLKEISFSLDAATAATYERIRGGDFAKALRGVSIMCEARRRSSCETLEVFVNMTLMRENISEASAFVGLAHSLGVDAIIFGQLLKFGDQPTWIAQRGSWSFQYTDQMIRNIPDLARRYLNEARDRARELGIKIIFLQNTNIYLD